MKRIESMNGTFNEITEAVKSVAGTLHSGLKQFANSARQAFNDFLYAMAAYIVPGKQLHLAKYAKKKRTRKKYHNRIIRAIFAVIHG